MAQKKPEPVQSRVSAGDTEIILRCTAAPWHATLEAIIHATRVKAFLNDEGEQKQVSKLLKLIDNCNDVVNRVAPNSSYSIVMADLMKRIDSWRSKTED